jgi:hypothetical protein
MGDQRSPYCPSCRGRIDGYYEVGGHSCVCNYLSEQLQAPQPLPTRRRTPTVPYELLPNDIALLHDYGIDPEEKE